MKQITIEQAAAFLTVSNLAIGHCVFRNGPKQKKESELTAEDLNVNHMRYRAMEALADGCGENEAERFWNSEFKSWVKSVKADMKKKDGYCVTALAKLGFEIIKTLPVS